MNRVLTGAAATVMLMLAPPAAAMAPLAESAAMGCFQAKLSADYPAKLVDAMATTASPPDDLRDALMTANTACLAELGLTEEQEPVLGRWSMSALTIPVMQARMVAAGLDPAIADGAMADYLAGLTPDSPDSPPPGPVIEGVVAQYDAAGVDFETVPEQATSMLGMYVGMLDLRAKERLRLGFTPDK